MPRYLTAGRLIEKLKVIPENTRIVVSGFDHSYRELRSGDLVDAEYEDGDLSESYEKTEHTIAVFLVE